MSANISDALGLFVATVIGVIILIWWGASS